MLIFNRDNYYETSTIDYDAVNDPYYDYMETGNRVYDYLNGSMREYKKPGALSYGTQDKRDITS